MHVPILYQNLNWIAVDKPEGVSVHNNEDPRNLLLILREHFGDKKLYPVHRLDKETSGIQVLALNETWAKNLATEFQNKSVKKTYRGLLRGQLKSPQGTWNQSLTDKAEGRRNPLGISRERLDCETRYKTIKDSKYFTLCEFHLITGRQHQIRKHTAVANHAIVGDSRYGDKVYNEKIAGLYKTSRMFLHCTRLELAGQSLESAVPAIFEEAILS